MILKYLLLDVLHSVTVRIFRSFKLHFLVEKLPQVGEVESDLIYDGLQAFSLLICDGVQACLHFDTAMEYC